MSFGSSDRFRGRGRIDTAGGGSRRRCRQRCRQRTAIAQVRKDEVLSGGDVPGAEADTAEGRQGDLAERQAGHSVHPAVGV